MVSVVQGDGNQANNVRRALQPLLDLTESRNITILGISHPPKGSAGKDPLDRVIQSQAYVALSRIVLMAFEHQKGGCVLTRAKSNIGPIGGGFHYDKELVELPKHGIQTLCIKWGDAIEGDNPYLIISEAESKEKEPGALDNAKAWLCDFLKDGPIPAKDVLAAGEEHIGVSKRTLKSAKKELSIESITTGGSTGKWSWKLPETPIENPFTNSDIDTDF